MPYQATIGLEVHAELNTRTKMFCSSKNDPDEKRPNVNICPVCMAHPGTLPVINKEAVRHILRMGLAISGTLADETEFDRKNYFYPDIPKGYQISQYERPLVSGGVLAGVAITRIHLEEDTARLAHADGASLVDFNRAGVPLMELVTEPVITTPEAAGNFARELQLLLRYLGVGEANMEKGEMRVEANISVSNNPDKLGTKVEVKNLNSFRSVERAIAFEVERQSKLITEGGKVIQETRGWNENKGETFSQRLKESSHDYRYFPDPDLPKLRIFEIPEFDRETLTHSLPELPWVRRARYLTLGLTEEAASAFVREPELALFFDSVIEAEAPVIASANYLLSDVLGFLAARGASVGNTPLTAESFGALMRMLESKSVSSRGAKDVLLRLLEAGGEPLALAQEMGLMQEDKEENLLAVVDNVMKQNPNVVKEVAEGKAAAVGFLVGKGMRELRGANPEVLRRLFEEKIETLKKSVDR